jgi:GNAT superfamily N-acetyltransferase
MTASSLTPFTRCTGTADVSIPDLVRQAALFYWMDLPDPAPEHPRTLVRRDGYAVSVFPGLSYGDVLVEAIHPERIGQVVEEARSLLATHGKGQGAWIVAEAAAPIGLADELRSGGMVVPSHESSLEPRTAAMVAISPPDPGPSDVDVQPVRSFEEYRLARRVRDEAFDFGEDDRGAFEAKERLLWEIEAGGGASRSFVARIDGEVVGYGGAMTGTNAVCLSGGSTRADMRGRGVYRALVRARWDAAVERGTPALTVDAGRMSRPILDRLGFTTVGWIDCLLDRFS